MVHMCTCMLTHMHAQAHVVRTCTRMLTHGPHMHISWRRGAVLDPLEQALPLAGLVTEQGPGGWWSSAQCPRETASEEAPACPQGAVGWACPNEPRIRTDTLPAPGPTPRHPAWASECELDWQAGAGPPWTPCLVPPTPLRAHVALPARGRTCPTRATAIHNRLQMGP